MVNMNKVKYVPYDIKLNVKIFKERTCLLSYQNSLEHEHELLNFIETGVKRVMPTILATHKAQDRHVYEQLINSDNPTILNAIASAFEP